MALPIYKVIDTTDDKYIGASFTIDDSAKTIHIVGNPKTINSRDVFQKIIYSDNQVRLINSNFCIKAELI